jgi:hypothetical protein
VRYRPIGLALALAIVVVLGFALHGCRAPVVGGAATPAGELAPIPALSVSTVLNGFTGGDILAGPGIWQGRGGPHTLLDYNGAPVQATLTVQSLGSETAPVGFHLTGPGGMNLFTVAPGTSNAETMVLKPGAAIEVTVDPVTEPGYFAWVVYKSP